MEFCDLGKHCSLKECRRQDYLPFQCKYCQNFYCLDHRSITEHKCSKYRELTRKVVPKSSTKYYCIVCQKNTKIEMKCPMCKKNTCLGHRHYHLCSEKIEKDDEKEGLRKWFCC